MRPLAGVLVLLASIAVPLAAAADAAGVGGPCLLAASAPGAYALRFWPDRVVLSYSADEPVTVRVGLQHPPRWVVGDDDAPLPASEWQWDAAAGCVSLELPAGDHRAQVGWAGGFRKPPAGLQIPVVAEGRVVGHLACSFDLERMTATGAVDLPTALARVLVEPAGKLSAETLGLRVGGLGIERWREREGGLLAAASIPVRPETPVTVTVQGYNLMASPVKGIRLCDIVLAYEPPRLPAMPPDGILIEAEAFTAEGDGRADISAKHFETSGGKCVYNNAGDGHWLEWRIRVPVAGVYDLYGRAACQEPESLRTLALDRKALPGAELVRFPGTGGWGYSAPEWAALHLAGAGPAHPPLALPAGEHTLRMTGVSSDHLNLDCFVLARRR